MFEQIGAIVKVINSLSVLLRKLIFVGPFTRFPPCQLPKPLTASADWRNPSSQFRSGHWH